ncbi:MAG TPA: type II/IV secretion system ATPase subunit [Candidatus Nitrosotenuis sp.]|nr:type II/IV secretion system ATPase subunit [Candidatus Nitrosotenuis sp.]
MELPIDKDAKDELVKKNVPMNGDAKKNTLFDKLGKLFSGKPKKAVNLKFELHNVAVPELESYSIVSQYEVGDSKVYIAKDQAGKMHYLVSEPPIGDKGKAVYSKIMNYLFVSLSYELPENEPDVRGFVRKKIIEISKELGLLSTTIKILDKLQYYVIRDSFGYGIIDVLMKDKNIEDIVEESFDKPVGVAHKEYGEYGILDTNIKFNSFELANSFVQKLVQRTGKSMTAAVPYIDTMTKDGSRIAATFGKEVSLPGPNFTIRKFSEEPYTITRLIELGTLNTLLAAYVWLLLEAKAFVLVIGSTAAGKTTTIGALSSLINPQMKITTIEDTPEIKIGHMHWQRLITRKSSGISEDKYEVTMDDLIKLSLRSRPDYIIVGEVRGKEISSLIQAVSTGHGGLTSFHAFDAASAFVRMESPPMNVHVGGQMLISALLHQKRIVDPDGKTSRRITEITEVVPKQNSISLNKVMEWDASSSQFVPTDIDEVISRSVRLKEIGIMNGWSHDEIASQLVTRMCFLSRMVNSGVRRFNDVTSELAKFYYDPVEKYMTVLNSSSLSDVERIRTRRA